MVKYLRKIISVPAELSPNVVLALQEKALGLKPSGRQVIPGVLSWEEYQHRRATWHPMRQCVGLDAQFWEGRENLLYPQEWLQRAEARARTLREWWQNRTLTHVRTGMAIGIDVAEGGDNTAMCVTDKLGVLELQSEKTTDTSVIPGKVKALGRKWKVAPENWIFDRGGGGNVHANHLRSQGLAVRTVGFGDPVSSNKKNRGQNRDSLRQTRQMKEDRIKDEKYVYMNKRAEMYHELSLLLDPSENPESFGIPPEYHELRFQMTPIPLLYDGDGKIYLPQKHPRGRPKIEPGQFSSGAVRQKTLVELIGHSPDELESLILAVHGMNHPGKQYMVGPAW